MKLKQEEIFFFPHLVDRNYITEWSAEGVVSLSTKKHQGKREGREIITTAQHQKEDKVMLCTHRYKLTKQHVV